MPPPHNRSSIVAQMGRRTLFWKVLVLISITTVASTVVIALYFRYVLRDSYSVFLREQVSSYMHLVVDDISIHPQHLPHQHHAHPAPSAAHLPDTARARLLTKRYPFDIAIEQATGTWSSTDLIPTAAVLTSETSAGNFDDGTEFLFRTYQDHLFGIIRHPEATYIVRMRSVPQETTWLLPTVLLVGALFLLFAAAYFYVQRFLRPIRELMKGVEAVSKGDFEFRIGTESNDELGELSVAFNLMAEQVAAIIASKRRLLFDVSHELRSPIARMTVALAMLPEGKARTSIERNARELNTMITELLENERLAVLGGKIVHENVEIVGLTRGVVDSFTEETARLEFDTLTESLPIVADSQRLMIAIRNVISNALKYSSSSDGPVKISVFPDDDGVRIVVADRGIGISPEAQAKVFEPFYRTDDSRSRATGGYGLGLSLTKSIVEAHGGAIQLTSVLGEGTTIMMWIPNTPLPQPVLPDIKASVRIPDKGREKREKHL